MPRLPINWDTLRGADKNVLINQLFDSIMHLSPIVNKDDLGAVQPASHFRRDGLIAYADGSDWNPNSQGKGFYRYEITGATGTWSAIEYTHPTDPTITDFSNATHTHANATQGGIVNASNADTVDTYHAATTPATSTIPVAKTSGEPVLNKGWYQPIAIFKEVQTSGTNGGGTTGGTWHTRTLNTTDRNDITGCSLSSNQITLPAGTYEIYAEAPAYAINNNKASLYNTTDTAYALHGLNSYAAGGGSASHAHITGTIVLAAQKVLEVRHYIQTTKATDGLGRAVSASVSEVYTTIKIKKIA